jgi:hypothetical protein
VETEYSSAWCAGDQLLLKLFRFLLRSTRGGVSKSVSGHGPRRPIHSRKRSAGIRIKMLINQCSPMLTRDIRLVSQERMMLDQLPHCFPSYSNTSQTMIDLGCQSDAGEGSKAVTSDTATETGAARMTQHLMTDAKRAAPPCLPALPPSDSPFFYVRSPFSALKHSARTRENLS